MISRIYATLKRADLPPADFASLKREILALRGLQKALRRPKKAEKSHISRPRRSKKPNLTEKTRFCKLCKRLLPHRKEDWQHHGRELRLAICRRGGPAYWRRVGYEKLYSLGHAAQFRAAMEKRRALFKEVAPRTFALMTAAEVDAKITSYRKKQGWLINIANLRCILKRLG